MKIAPLSTIGFLLLCLVAWPAPLAAQEGGEAACKTALQKELAKEQRLYRAVLFGEPSATGATLGKVKFDSEGDPWIKIRETGDTWASVSGKGEDSITNAQAAQKFGMSVEAATSAGMGTTRVDDEGVIFIKVVIPAQGINEWRTALTYQNDEDMDESAEIQWKRGIFDTKRTLTSELVPYLTQSMRALQCRTVVMCEAVEQSITAEEGTVLEIDVPGCLPASRPAIAACQLGAAERPNPEESNMRTYCQTIADQMLEREADLLKLAVEYDAAYRTILQFAGNFDLFLQEFRWPLTFTIRSAAGIIGQLNRIPCFLSTCDAYPKKEDLR